MASGNQGARAAGGTITVVGGGIFGLSCAWELARRGAPVRLIEADRIGAGSSGGTVGALAPHAPEAWTPLKALQRDALVEAEAWWAGIADAGGIDAGYARSGRVQPVTPEGLDRARARAAASDDLWPAPFRLTLTDAPPAGLVPASASGLWLVDNLTARLAPRKACHALASALRAAGVEVVEQAGPQHPGALPGPAIWAAGAPGLAMLGADLGRVAGNGVKGQSALLRFAADDAAQVFADGLHIVPHADGTVAIGSTSERDVTDTGTDAQLDALVDRARAICPALKDAPVVDRWAGIRPRAASRAPLLGPWPGRPGHIVANGGFKIGFAMAPVVAGMAADLILTGTSRIPEGWRV